MTTTADTQTTTLVADPRDTFRRGVAVGTSTIGSVRAEQLANPTPCHEYDVRGLLGHLVGVLNRAAAIGRGENAMTVPAEVDASDDAWPAAWASAAAAFDAAWTDDATLTRIVVLPWATQPGGGALLGYLNEVVVHVWDLAQATGQQPTWDDEVVAAAYGAISHALPAEGRQAVFEKVRAAFDEHSQPAVLSGPPFGEAVAVAADASPIDRLVAYTGRKPA